MADLTLTRVWKVYKHGVIRRRHVVAVRDLSLDVSSGEFLAILGPSGCGKTSTLRMIAGLEEITSGEISIGGRIVSRLEPSERNVAMAFESYALYPHLTVRDNLAFSLRHRRLSSTVIERRVQEMADMLRIGDVLDARPGRLSGGQAQRVSLARALMRQPDVFLLDEPLSQLEPVLRFEIRTLVKELITQLGTTTIYVTHDQHEATALADRIAVMNQGELQQVGTRDVLYHSPINRFVADFVGEPPITLFECEVVELAMSPHEGIGPLWRHALVGAGGEVAFPLSWTARDRLGNRRRTIVGIRPQDLHAHPREGDLVLHGRVYANQWMGDERHLALRVGELDILAVVPPDFSVQPGSNLSLYFSPESLHVFDLETGVALFHGHEVVPLSSWRAGRV